MLCAVKFKLCACQSRVYANSFFFTTRCRLLLELGPTQAAFHLQLYFVYMYYLNFIISSIFVYINKLNN